MPRIYRGGGKSGLLAMAEFPDGEVGQCRDVALPCPDLHSQDSAEAICDLCLVGALEDGVGRDKGQRSVAGGFYQLLRLVITHRKDSNTAAQPIHLLGL